MTHFLLLQDNHNDYEKYTTKYHWWVDFTDFNLKDSSSVKRVLDTGTTGNCFLYSCFKNISKSTRIHSFQKMNQEEFPIVYK